MSESVSPSTSPSASPSAPVESQDTFHGLTSGTPIITLVLESPHATLDATLPFPTIEARGGARLDVDIPFPSIDASAIHGNVGLLDVDLPFPTIEATGYVGITAELDESLPFPNLYARAVSGGRFDDYVLRHSRGL